MDETVFAELPRRTQERLAALSAAVDAVAPTDIRAWPIEIAGLPDAAGDAPLLREVHAWAAHQGPVLYYLECLSTGCDFETMLRAFQTAKALPAPRAYPRANAPSECLYVGSSRSLALRLKDHLGYGSRHTYGLHLLHWARPLGLTLELVCAAYARDVTAEVMQALEDMLWDLKSPMFGRRGQR